MTYYETPAGAKVFAGGAIDFGGSAMITGRPSDAREPVGTPGDAVARERPQAGTADASGTSRGPKRSATEAK